MPSVLNKLSRQFLCGLPLNEFSLADVDLNLENQEILLNATVNAALVLEYPLKIDYQKAFLKCLLDKLEKQDLEIHEDLYAAYGRLVAVSEAKSECYKHYRIDTSGTVISLRENIKLISEGTTGLRTWQASLALAEWCLNNKNALLDKNILELGSGIGLTGLVASFECEPKHFYFSDCHPSVLKTLIENIEFNCKHLFTKDHNSLKKLEERVVIDKQLPSGVNVSVLNLPWEQINNAVCEKLGTIDVILAADVVYDSELFKSLVDGLRCISVICHVKDIVFACTERNSETLDTFLEEIGKHFKVCPEACPSQKTFVWSANPPVRFFRFNLF